MRVSSTSPKAKRSKPRSTSRTSGSSLEADGERLQKVLARAGFGSRRTNEALIADGRVTVNGEVAVLGRRVDPATDRIALDGVPVIVDTTLVHWLLNKPAGYVTTAHDTHDRPTVLDLVPAEPRVFPVGRLDLETEGLLLADERRRPHPAAHAPAPRRGEGVLRRGRGQAVAGGAPRAAGRRRARRRPDLAGPGEDPADVGGGHDRAVDRGPGRTQADGAADVRGGRPSGGAARPHAHRAVAGSAPRAGRVARADADEVRALYGAGLAGHDTDPSASTARRPSNVATREIAGAPRRDDVRRGHQGRDRRQDAGAGAWPCSSATRSRTTTS